VGNPVHFDSPLTLILLAIACLKMVSVEIRTHFIATQMRLNPTSAAKLEAVKRTHFYLRQKVANGQQKPLKPNSLKGDKFCFKCIQVLNRTYLRCGKQSLLSNLYSAKWFLLNHLHTLLPNYK
jgi:hypothetical protein